MNISVDVVAVEVDGGSRITEIEEDEEKGASESKSAVEEDKVSQSSFINHRLCKTK